MKIEANLQDHEPRIVSGVKGLKSTPFTKRFRNQAAMERWLDSDNAGSYDIYQIERA
jgi:hypothetical protein